MPHAQYSQRISGVNQMMTRPKTVFQYPNDPRIFLFVMDEWYFYNPYEKPIGEGALGIVYLGYCCSDNRPVAVKRIKDTYANNRQIRDRAKNEASLAYRHQNLVEMLGYCEYAQNYGPIFLVSNYVQGKNIDLYVKGLINSPDRVEKICIAICSVLDALDFIHAHNLVHRDVKPSNIMIEQNSNVRLMDLGIAKANEGNPYSQYGFIGTPEYSAPEQIRADREGIGKTTDIYELGITFYELLAGENPMACPSEAETLAKQMLDPLPSNNKIPRRLFKVIQKATEKEQMNRYQTAIEFKTAIQEALTEPLPLWKRLYVWINNHIILFMGILLLLGLILIAIFTILNVIIWS